MTRNDALRDTAIPKHRASILPNLRVGVRRRTGESALYTLWGNPPAQGILSDLRIPTATAGRRDLSQARRGPPGRGTPPLDPPGGRSRHLLGDRDQVSPYACRRGGPDSTRGRRHPDVPGRGADGKPFDVSGGHRRGEAPGARGDGGRRTRHPLSELGLAER